MTSAVRVGGERLYRKAQARRGGRARRRARSRSTGPSCSRRGEGTATFEIECSSGTYVRTLIEELDDAYCEELRRTAIGDLPLAERRRRTDPAAGRSSSRPCPRSRSTPSRRAWSATASGSTAPAAASAGSGRAPSG